MKRSIILLFGIILSIFFDSNIDIGAIRDDVPDEKYLSLALESQFSAVGLILIDNRPNASAVLIDKSWILTAGHVIIDKNADNIKFQLGEMVSEIESINIFPGYSESGLGHGGDLALLKLNEPLENVETAKLYDGTNELGKIGTMVGFGRSGSGASIIKNPTLVGTKRAGENSIDSIGGIIDGRKIPDYLLVSDFDHPRVKELNRIGSPIPAELEYCPVGGDSGGGLFIKEENRWFLVGIFSGFSPKINDDIELGLHGSLMYWIRLTDFNEWVTKTMSN